MTYNFKTADNLKDITQDVGQISEIAGSEIDRLQNIQNTILNNGSRLARMTNNKYLSNIKTGQNQIITGAVANRYANQSARDNLGILEQQARDDLAKMFNKNITEGVSSVTNTILEGSKALYDLESKKRNIALGELRFESTRRQYNELIRQNWSKYDLAKQYMDLAWDKLDFTKSENKLDEEIEI